MGSPPLKIGEVGLGAHLKGYGIPNQLVEQIYEDTGLRTAPLRGIGFTANKFAAEVFVDEIALKKGIDPLKFRSAATMTLSVPGSGRCPRSAAGSVTGGYMCCCGAVSCG